MASASPNLTFKALSALLAYPGEDLVAAAPAIADVLALEGLVAEPARAGLAPLLEELAQDDLFALQETYVGLFDRTRRLSLHLFEHVHGESRDRGQAMVDLAALYEKGGLVLVANELPDYLPLFLEFLSTRPLPEAQALIADIAHILASLEERLIARSSAYAAVFAALRTLATDGAVAAPAPAPAVDEPVDDLAALDAAWEETAVTFGPGEGMGACSVDRFRTQLRAAQRDARHTAA
ncbi:nitrate reductase molybdenum cofactor assembly chaperone [Xanthobacter oligotrophicus]|uniref:nitrate reductase molybdenum cofactor assembly chaperone n=1 Tax=Xanthobacter oligotrophicus TaxID=2607286 RepID=UPI0011F13312|nr:nitrate reductase molybdenum cofactor assembly chaperone [Xanthobacter oligotrophicus]MCG5234831.1 nitrate reductase molybdenum cofactor assembly chaperone [Xanthobacter oligotrophicus]